jgi:hypothetical protein
VSYVRVIAALAAVVVVLGGVYAVACWARPFARCFRCSGTARIARFGRERPCRWCAGGRRLRLGRRAYNFFAARRVQAAVADRRVAR